VAQELKYHGTGLTSSQMKHSSRCNDRSSVGRVELFLVNLNDDGNRKGSYREFNVSFGIFEVLNKHRVLNSVKL
jgi:hypothetical protein